MNNEHEFLTVKEAAAFLRLSPDTIRVLCLRGELAGAVKLRLGRSHRWRIPRQAVLAKCEIHQPLALDYVPMMTPEELRKACPNLVEMGLL